MTIARTNPSDTIVSDVLTTHELAAFLKVTASCVISWRSKGIGPVYFKLGNDPQSPVRYRRSEVEGWLKSRVRFYPLDGEKVA